MSATDPFLQRLDNASLSELRELIRSANKDQAALLRVWMGASRYERMRKLLLKPGLRQAGRKSQPKKLGKVVVLHGIMGAELSLFRPKGPEKIWVSPVKMAFGRLRDLEMDRGLPKFDSGATDMMRKFYMEALVTLDDHWDVEPFWFDWRRDLAASADELAKAIKGWFGDDEPVHLVAHSMGGLVARTFIHRHKKRWEKGGHLLMMGTPNHGSFAIPQVITGVHKMVRKIGKWLDQFHSVDELSKLLNTFPGSLHMLPSPLVMPGMEKMYSAATWPGRNVSQAQLDQARKHHDLLADVVDPERMIYVAGSGFDTADDVADWDRMGSLEGYHFSRAGDGTVPHRLGKLETADGTPLRTWYAAVEHGDLLNHPDTVDAANQYLHSLHASGTGEIAMLSQRPIDAARHATRSAAVQARAAAIQSQEAEVAAFARRVPQVRGLGGDEAVEIRAVDAVQMEREMVRGFLGGVEEGESSAGKTGAPPKNARPVRKPQVELSVRVRVTRGGIEKVTAKRGRSRLTALAAGHYAGVEPQSAELALDRMLSRALGMKGTDGELFITEATQRGTFAGDLGKVTVIPLPNQMRVAIAGMGQMSEFGRAELTVVARELCWALSRMGCEDLNTILIGSGNGNLDTRTALEAWLEGIRRAGLAGAMKLKEITFVEFSAEKFVELSDALEALLPVVNEKADGVQFELARGQNLTEARKAALKEMHRDLESALRERLIALENRQQEEPKKKAPIPTRITISKQMDGYEFGALTEDASFPLRRVEIDPLLVEGVSRRLVSGREDAFRWGRTFERLVIPADLRSLIFRSKQPVVLTVDATTARLPWEMMVLPEAGGSSGGSGAEGGMDSFIGSAGGFGLTRQLKTRFAPVPTPQFDHRRALRVLVVADPAPDAPLLGAQEEGLRVAEIFEGLTLKEHGVEAEVTTLIGPSEATREDVAALLLNRHYDVLHFAGHCAYDVEDPRRSGWIFHAGRNERITAAELARLDRVPTFVFSNACESGITPERRDEATLALGPTFAEAFFDRGVRNFVCTAWPVSDAAALTFAETLYGSLFASGGTHAVMSEAMRLSRVRCAEVDFGTWGAYQHYGDPMFRFG